MFRLHLEDQYNIFFLLTLHSQLENSHIVVLDDFPKELIFLFRNLLTQKQFCREYNISLCEILDILVE